MTDASSSRKRATEEEVLQELESKRPAFEEFCRKIKEYIEERLESEEIQIQSVQWRVKDAKKVKSKYSDPSKGEKYTCLDDLTDIAGLRVITYYETDIDIVRQILEREFAVDLDNSHDKRIPIEPERFTYHALHLVVSLKPETLGNQTHKKFAQIRGEIQITSILRHAWAEIEHKWYDLKDSFPAKAKRRFARLSALIEMADEEFVSLRNEYEQSKQSANVMVAIGDQETPIDVASLRAFIEQEPLVAAIDREIVLIRDSKLTIKLPDHNLFAYVNLLRQSGLTTVGSLRADLERYREAILDYDRELQSAPTQPVDGDIVPEGVCTFQLGMMLFLDDFYRANTDNGEQFNQQKLHVILLGMQILIRPIDDVYPKQALLAHRILKKYGR